MKTFKILFAAVIIAGFTTSAMAQSDDINAVANVLQSATIEGARDLDFGNVTIGENKTVEANDADNSGHFILTTNAASSISFVFPENLTTEVDGVTRNLPVNFDGNFARILGLDNDGGDVSADFNPTTLFNLASSELDFDHAGTFDIYLGGEVIPEANQPAGNYSAEVTLSVTFN